MKKILLFFISVIAIQTYAQDEILPVSDVEVVKAFEAQLAKAKRIPLKPEEIKTSSKKENFAYNINIEPLKLQYPDPEIRPIAYQPEALPDPKHLYLKAGYGSLRRPQIDLGYALHLEDLYKVAFWGSYLGGDNQKTLVLDQYDFGLKGSYFLNDYIKTNANINFLRENRVIQTGEIAPTSLVHRKYQDVDVGFGISNNSRIADKLEYSANFNLSLNQFKEFSDDSEVSWTLPLAVNYHLSEKMLFLAHHELLFSGSKSYADAWVSDLKIGIKSNFSPIHLDLGASLITANEKSYFFPITRLSYEIQQDKGRVFIGSDQEKTQNNFDGIYEVNPFFRSDSIENNTSIKASVYAGTEWKVSKLEMELKGGYQIHKLFQDFYYYETTDIDFLFLPRYTSGNSIFIKLSSQYQISNGLETGISGEKQFYNFDQELAVPDLNFQAFARWWQKDKYSVKGIVHYRNMGAQNSFFIEQLLTNNDLIDLSINAEYFLSKNFGFYIEAHNLLNRNYQRWYSYPDFAFNVFGGIKLIL